MAIKITNYETKPALVYDNWFLKNLSLTQKTDTSNMAMPYYTLKVEYQLFAIDEENIRHFNPKVYVFEIDNYVQAAMEKAHTGDTDLIVAMQAIEKALASIVEDQTDLGTASVI